VPAAGDLFTRSFTQSMNDDLATKPKAQKSLRDTYHVWMNPVLAGDQFMRFYYQVHKDADEQMMKVFNALQKSRYKDNTIVVFTSDHGELLLAHGGMKQKMYQAYDETTRVPLMIWYPAWFKGPRTIDALTSHADFLPTLLGLAGIEPEPIRQKLATNHSDALPLVGRDLSSIILGGASPSKVNDPVYYMTEDDPTRGLHMKRKMGVGYYPIVQPAHVETVIARLDDGHLWKYSRYFDNPQYWSEPGTPGDAKKPARDVLRVERQKDPAPEVYRQPETIPCELTVKGTPVPDEFEMYDLDDDPTELKNLYGNAKYSTRQSQLAKLLKEQRTLKRLSPISGKVPGQA
jgi:choline-sulfatase